MKSIKIMTAIASLMATTLACDTIEKSTDTTVIGKQQNIDIENGRMSPEVLWAMGRIGSPSVSPDGKKIAYTVSYYSIKLLKVIDVFGCFWGHFSETSKRCFWGHVFIQLTFI